MMLLRTPWAPVGASCFLLIRGADLRLGCMKKERKSQGPRTHQPVSRRPGCSLLSTPCPCHSLALAPVPFSFFPLVDSWPVTASPTVEKPRTISIWTVGPLVQSGKRVGLVGNGGPPGTGSAALVPLTLSEPLGAQVPAGEPADCLERDPGLHSLRSGFSSPGSPQRSACPLE